MKGKFLLLVISSLFIGLAGKAQEDGVQTNVKKGSISWTSSDNQFKYSVGGRVYFDAATYFDDETELGSGSELRDVRLLFKATVWNKWDAKINVSFAGGKVSAKDIFLQYNVDKNRIIRSGYFFEPFGLERTESSKSIKFLEVNSTTEAFAPGRNLGVEYSQVGDNYYLGAGLFGDSDVNNTKGGDEGVGLTSRFVYTPVNEKGKILHLGVAATYRSADAEWDSREQEEVDKTISYQARAETHIERRRFIGARVDAAENQFKYGFELLGISGPFSLQSEYIDAKVHRDYDLENYSANGWYAQFSWLVKGAQYSYKMKSARLAKPSPGSMELILRYNQTNLNDEDVLIMGGKQNDLSLGGIYYINHNILVKINYANVNLDKYSLNGDENFGMIQARLQMAF